ncbi:endonuclease/exonuclease/phosphatase family protein [Kribbella deserti]|uniref:Endonuclease/exonuclease/phosphatase family protein n=1 Tax=Kribbella deserti TaxID=1926257 RepID=A0ABV6QJM7_9ACTN
MTDAGLRVLSYNVHRWGDDREALARVVRACAPDVALIQEAPTWWGTRRKREAMAATFGLRYVGGAARNAILAADTITLSSYQHWRVWRPFIRRRLRLIATQLPGGAIGARTVLPGEGQPVDRETVSGREVALVVCHLGLHVGGRLREFRQVIRGCESFGVPYLLVGDLNEEPGGDLWAKVAEAGLTDNGEHLGPTFPARAPGRRIDAALTSPGLTVNAIPLSEVPGLDPADLPKASDHLPMLLHLT